MAFERLGPRGWFLLLAFPWALGAQSSPEITGCDHAPTYTPCDLVITLTDRAASQHPHPYTDVELRAEFRSPKGHTYAVPAFWDGGRRMVLRFSPTEAGDWEYKLTSNLTGLDAREGAFTAVATDSLGFIRPDNVHHWSYTERRVPHLWMGVTELRYAFMDGDAFHSVVDARAAQKFTHFRGLIMGQGLDPAYAGADAPNLAFFQELDQRVRYINDKHMVADLILAGGANFLYNAFPAPEDRRRYIRFIAARYAAMNVTWQLVDRFEETNNARDLLKDLGAALKEFDPYQHPRSTGAAVTSAPLLDDGWETYTCYGPADDAVGAIEHQLYGVPGVSVEGAREDSGAGRTLPQDVDSDHFRHRMWNATMDGLYPGFTNTGDGAKYGNSPGARAMTVWYDLMTQTRHWELEPYFDVDGGRALALEGVEYLVYIEKPGPVEMDVEQHGYDVIWIDPADGSVIRRKYSGSHFTAEPPSRTHDWLLHVVRETELASMAKSYKFESVDVVLQEVESHPDKVVFEVVNPTGPLSISKAAPYEAKLTRASRGTRNMMWLWTGEVFADHLGYRVLATGASGAMQIPSMIAGNLPATMLLRVYGLNALGKVYMVSKGYDLNK
ncbi:MAG TPA: DUF5060 domain-containing protein [Verrucomicrobiae bacterium]|nr:DUF5060 domain-containing protein [Verrucomicrobiae bacterium]